MMGSNRRSLTAAAAAWVGRLQRCMSLRAIFVLTTGLAAANLLMTGFLALPPLKGVSYAPFAVAVVVSRCGLRTPLP